MKWSFNKKYGLQAAVLEKTKTNTRREPFEHDFKDFRTSFDKDNHLCVYDGDKLIKRSKVGIGNVVAIAQPYKEIISQLPDRIKEYVIGFYSGGAGWTNKMFVRADLMPRMVKVTGIKAERLKDISDEDSLNEGIKPVNSENVPQLNETRVIYYTFSGVTGIWTTPRQAFAALIDKVSGKGTWRRNPWVFAYEFELVKLKEKEEK